MGRTQISTKAYAFKMMSSKVCATTGGSWTISVGVINLKYKSNKWKIKEVEWNTKNKIRGLPPTGVKEDPLLCATNAKVLAT